MIKRLLSRILRAQPKCRTREDIAKNHPNEWQALEPHRLDTNEARRIVSQTLALLEPGIYLSRHHTLEETMRIEQALNEALDSLTPRPV